jgi:dipeptidyl aminopeptidase/acylaminoacyl peptidase
MREERNIAYVENTSKGFHNERHRLDVFAPREGNHLPVLVFVHGGAWYHGSKDIYSKLGHHLAEMNVVTVITNYRLGPNANFMDMAEDCARAIKWAYDTIEKYGGDRNRIFISGHSAGGHLSALITLDPKYFDHLKIRNPIKGCILIDAFGMNMDFVLKINTNFFVSDLHHVFTNNPTLWREAAPVNFVKGCTIPILIFVGLRTYPYIMMDNEVFVNHLNQNKVPHDYHIIPGKGHMEMISQLETKTNPIYSQILNFMR